MDEQETTPKRAHKTHKTTHRTTHAEEKESSMLYYVLIGMVCLLLIFSVVQTVQISNIKEKVKTGSVSVAAGPAPAPAPAPAPRAAPTMVGGC